MSSNKSIVQKRLKYLRIIAIGVLIFLGLTGLWGGYELMTHPNGESLNMPLELLRKTPFQTYFIPGAFLFFGNGVLSLVVAWLSLKRVRKYPLYIILQGSILLVWLTAELVLNADFFFPQTHITYYLLGFILIWAGLRIWKSRQID